MRPWPTLALTLTLALAACGAPARPVAQGQPATPAPAQSVEVLASGLDTPWAIAFSPDGRIFLTERPGRIRVIQAGRLDAEPWLTLDVAETGEGGLLGLSLDPDFAQNRFLYVAHTYRDADGALRNRLVRLREDPETGRGAVDRVLLDGAPGANLHDGGRVRFGPDGRLYWTLGDAQSPQLAQDTSALNGKILRLNPDGTVPPDNPFPGSPVYAYGLRNAQGLAWQPGSGRLYATEHGPSGGPEGCCRDEINLIEPAGNYGWPLVAGDQPRQGTIPPVITSGPADTWAPAGATFVAQGPWQGSLLLTGLRSQTLFRLTLDPADPRRVTALERLLERQHGRLRDVAQGPDGAIYLLTSNSDGRGDPRPQGDQVLRLSIAQAPAS